MIRYIYLFFLKLCNHQLNDEYIDETDVIDEYKSNMIGEYNSEGHNLNKFEYFKLNSTYHEEHV